MACRMVDKRKNNIYDFISYVSKYFHLSYLNVLYAVSAKLCIGLSLAILICSLFLPQVDKTFLIIGTLSAQKNFEFRQSIRDTWLRLGVDQNLKHYFVIGEHFCKIPVEDRISVYSCEELDISILQTEGLSTHKLVSPEQFKPFSTGFSFVTHHKIVIRRLNMLSMKTLSPVRVSLFDSVTSERVLFALFTSSNHNSNYIFIPKLVEPYILPKGFEGSIVMEFDVEQNVEYPKFCPGTWNNANGLISFLQLISNRNEKPRPFNYNSCPIVSMTIDVYDVDELKFHVDNKISRQAKWVNEVTELQSSLQNESKVMKDIVFLDIIDSYRNLPIKLLKFHEWLYENEHFSYLLKTDDDSFIDLSKLIPELVKIDAGLQSFGSSQPYFWWWGSFRSQWAVRTNGKWRDDFYNSLTYPPFPCGSGYILNEDIVGYVASNAELLQTNFQGEDVSVGIWLAGLKNTKHISSHQSVIWSCDSECHHNSYNRAQLTVPQMYSTWDVLQMCGSLCNCSDFHS